MRSLRILAGAALPLALWATAVFAQNTGPVEPLAFGDTVYDLAGPSVDGSVVSLSDLAIDRAKAEAVVLELAGKLNEEGDVTLGSTIADLPGLQDGDARDADAVLDFASRVGMRFGLIPHAEKVAAAETLGDIADWVVASESAPILIVAWSPRCPKCRGIYDERTQAIVAETGIRLLVLASNYPDQPEDVREYLEEKQYHWNVILDPKQRLTDRLGGRKTPHLFLLDADRTLHFRGAHDNDPQGSKEGDARKDYLRNAIDAVRAGHEIDASMNESLPAG